jgi:cysteine desulfurase / selenocysteine lyase
MNITLLPEQNWLELRSQFPVLQQHISKDVPLIYLDNAASSQMPQSVIDKLVQYQSTMHSNVHRGAHTLAQRATEAFESVRSLIATTFNARPEECIFVRGATEAINLIAHGYGRKFLVSGDEIILTMMEHHANIVPWQMLAASHGITIKVVHLLPDGTLDLDHYQTLFTARTKLVGCIHVSNVLGTINPLEKIIAIAHSYGTYVLVDGCQAAPHLAIDLQALDVDFYTFSAHKMYGPTGVGILYGKEDLLNSMDPFMGGGDMIETVTFSQSTFKATPQRFEAGTPPLLSVVGFGEALKYVHSIGLDQISKREHELTEYALSKLTSIKDLALLGSARDRVGIFSFNLKGINPHDLGSILDQCGIAVRVGRHCAEPLLAHYGLTSAVRASLAFYNTESDIDALCDGLETAREILL